MKKRFDFSGYATKFNIKCADGRIIRKDAFKHNDGQIVPLVWQHIHNDPSNVLGHALLENKEDGVYAYCTFNDTDAAKHAKILVEHGDITALSIYANQLKQKGSEVIHGMIRELSLVLAGSNPGALIDNLCIQHSDGGTEIDDTEAIIYSGEEDTLTIVKHAATDVDEDEETIQEIFDTLNDKQKTVVYAMLSHAMKKGNGDGKEDDEMKHSDDEGGNTMKKNVFDKEDMKEQNRTTLTHSQIKAILEDAQKCGSLKEAFLAHAAEYGIENIDYLFPDAKTVTQAPELLSRRMEWVQKVLSGTKHSPFSRIKSLIADITADEARAKGYVKGNLKKEEIIKLLKRITTPTTIYKKQKLDRDDVVDITDLDIIAWLKAEMRLMLDEETARAVLIGDGREPDHPDKINEENIRPIAFDDDMYAHKVVLAPHLSGEEIIEAIIRARNDYKGSGTPSFYASPGLITDLLLLKDKIGRRLYRTLDELASALMVSEIVPVEPMQEIPGLHGIVVNLKDYTIGADKGGAVSMFDDFDIDYNQHKYLIETRISGALTKPKSAIIIMRGEGILAVPEVPGFNAMTGVVTIPNVAGVDYYIDDVMVSAGPQAPIEPGSSVEVVAKPAVGYYFPHNFDADWVFVSEQPVG